MPVKYLNHSYKDIQQRELSNFSLETMRDIAKMEGTCSKMLGIHT